jgi:hypothetical protein
VSCAFSPGASFSRQQSHEALRAVGDLATSDGVPAPKEIVQAVFVDEARETAISIKLVRDVA